MRSNSRQVRLRFFVHRSRAVAVPFFGLLLTLVATLSQPRPAVASTDRVAEVEAAYADLQSFRADFRQETVQGGMFAGRAVTSTGDLAFRRGHLRWNYHAPEPQTYVVDGASLLWVQPWNHQVVRVELQQAFDTSTSIVRLIGGLAALGSDFRLVEDEGERDGLRWLRLEPVEASAQIEVLRLGFDRRQRIARVVEVRDGFGNLNRVTLSAIHRNVEIPDETFRFELPRGWRVFSPEYLQP